MSEDQETDLWWGSYSGWTMWPSFVGCLLLTAAIAWLVWRFLERDLLQIAFLGVGTVLWVCQFARWGRRVFGFNYRLTTRRLFRDTGYFRQNRLPIDLKSITDVFVRQNGLEKYFGVGRVVVRLADPRYPPIVLEGVVEPLAIADLIRTAAEKLLALQKEASGEMA